MGLVNGIALKPSKNGKIELPGSVYVAKDGSITGNWLDEELGLPQGQIGVLSLNDWGKICHALGKKLPWQSRGATFCLQSMWFCAADIGKHLFFGRGRELVLKIESPWAPGDYLDTIAPGLQAAAAQGLLAGVCCSVYRPGSAHLQSDVVMT
jgi:hypothetical protein